MYMNYTFIINKCINKYKYIIYKYKFIDKFINYYKL